MMKNLSNFENFLVESKPLYLGENIFIDVQPDNRNPQASQNVCGAN